MLGKISKQLRIPVVCLLVVVGMGLISHGVSASGETISADTSATTEIKTASAISGLTINGTGNSVVPVKLLVTSGTLSMTTTTGLTFKDVNGNTVSNPQTGSTLYFSGARSDVNAALATLKYTRNSTGTDTLEISLVNPGEVFFSGNNHLYEYVSSTLDWNAARTAAASRTKDGATGYLSTITSQAENDFVSARLAGAGWMGASDSTTEGTWKWVTGPETGTTFCINNVNCIVQSGQYANWNNGEPNDSGSNEDCAQFLAGGTGKWNDLPCSGTTLTGYVVEYGAPGNLPTVAASNIAITTSDTTAPTAPGTPSTSTPTATQKPTWSWSASTDSGVGLANPAYTVQWSQDSSFVTGVSSATTNSTSYTHATNLSDGTWYFRVKATDLSSNTTAYSTAGSVLIDTSTPTTPSIGATTIDTRFTPSSLSWGASSDSGAGLANPAYTVQWSQSPSFASGNSSATTNGTFYTTVSLSQGTWYFRIKATDTLGQASAWSNIVTIVYDTTAPSTPGAPSTGSPTNNAKPTWNWTASTDSGSGLNNPAYSVQWSQASDFSSGITSATTNTNSFMQPSNLASGTWYFRVKASDDAGNDSAYSLAGSVVVDTVAPGISDILASSVSNSSETITWTTDKQSSTQLQYGPTVAYGTTTTLTDTSPRVTSHSSTLSGLVACTLYHYTVTAIDATTNSTTSSDHEFITSGCAGAATVTAHTDTQVPISTGGDLSLSNSGSVVSLSVPANFAGVDADFQIKKLDAVTAFDQIGTPSGLEAVGNVYDIKAMQDTTTAITSFNGQVSVTMNYTGSDLAKFMEDSLIIYRWDSGPGWQKLTSCTIDTSARTVTCLTPGFSTFALFGQKAPVLATAAQTTASAAVTKTPTKHVASATTSTMTEPAASDIVAALTGEEPSGSRLFKAQTAPETFATTVAAKGANKLWYGSLIGIALIAFWWLIAAKRRSHDKNNQTHA